jgi:hypothetical protein
MSGLSNEKSRMSGWDGSLSSGARIWTDGSGSGLKKKRIEISCKKYYNFRRHGGFSERQELVH